MSFPGFETHTNSLYWFDESTSAVYVLSAVIRSSNPVRSSHPWPAAFPAGFAFNHWMSFRTNPPVVNPGSTGGGSDSGAAGLPGGATSGGNPSISSERFRYDYTLATGVTIAVTPSAYFWVENRRHLLRTTAPHRFVSLADCIFPADVTGVPSTQRWPSGSRISFSVPLDLRGDLVLSSKVTISAHADISP
jgi:hypothetical protein